MDNDNNFNHGIIAREASFSDLNGMAKCHIDAFPDQFMSKMGIAWLKALYGYYLQHEKGISVVVVDENENVLGLAVGGDNGIRGEFLNKAIFKYPHLLLWKFLTHSIVRKKLSRELLTKLQYKKKKHVTKKQTNESDCGVLLSIGVLRNCRGKGVADKVLTSFCNASKEKYRKLRLTVETDNARAISFYRRNNWYEVGTVGESTSFHLDLTN